eukprot:6022826-Amphidinium_carterae.1
MSVAMSSGQLLNSLCCTSATQIPLHALHCDILPSLCLLPLCIVAAKSLKVAPPRVTLVV